MSKWWKIKWKEIPKKIFFQVLWTVQIFVWWHFLKAMLSKTQKSSFSKYQVATLSVLIEITLLVLTCWQWAWQMKILMVSLQVTLWNLFCWHLSHIFKISSCRGRTIALDMVYYWITMVLNIGLTLIAQKFFLCILVTDLQSSAFLQHMPTWPVTVSTGCIGQGRGQQLRAGQPGQILLRADLPQDWYWYTSIGSLDVKCYF